MNNKIKVARKIDFLVSINYSIENNLLKQEFRFWTNNKKNLKYAYDKRFLLKPKLDKLVLDSLLNDFKTREDNEDNITIYYKDASKVPANRIVNMEFYLPPYNGCKYCTKAEINGNFVYCKEKKKHYVDGGVKNCKVFKSIDEVLT